MTDLRDQPTSSNVDLTPLRWEVETSVPVAITGETAPGDADLVIASYATQLPSDTEFSQTFEKTSHQIDLHYIASATREERDDSLLSKVIADFGILLEAQFGLRQSYSILAIGVQGTVMLDGRLELSFEPGHQEELLQRLLADFVALGTGIRSMSQRDIITGILEQFPVPIFGSPPSDINTITQLMQGSPFVAAVGYGVWSESPALVVIGAGTGLVVWFARPAANVLRRTIAERLARKLGTEYRPDTDEK